MNFETKESRGSLPELLALARAVQRVDGGQEKDEALKKAEKKTLAAETKRRELEVAVNHMKADAQAQRTRKPRFVEKEESFVVVCMMCVEKSTHFQLEAFRYAATVGETPSALPFVFSEEKKEKTGVF